MQPAVALQNFASMLVCFGHQTLDAMRFLIRLDHSHGPLGVIQHGHDRFVAGLALLRLSYRAVVTGGLGRLAVCAKRVAHGLSQNLQRYSVLLSLYGGGRMAKQVAGHADSFARKSDEHHAVYHQADKAVDDVSGEMSALPLEEVSLSAEVLSFGVPRVIHDGRYLTTMCGFEQARD